MYLLRHSKFKPDVDGDHGAASAGCRTVHPHDDLRHATVAATQRVVELSRQKGAAQRIGEMLDERSFVNAIVGLHATGGSTNRTLHLPAMTAAGINLTWQDFADLSEITPLLARIYPNGSADELFPCRWWHGVCCCRTSGKRPS